MILPTYKRERLLSVDATGLQLRTSRPLWNPFAGTLRAFQMSRLLFLYSCLLGTAFAGVGGSISGTVKDPSGAAIPQACVVLVNSSTGVRQSTNADAHGAYTFPVVPVGGYVFEVDQPGFRPYRRTGIVVDVNSALLLDIVLEVGKRTDAVTVSDSAVHLETYSSQMGEVISGEQMNAMPLNGRSYTDLLSLQPGVVPSTSISSNPCRMSAPAHLSPSGDLNPGTISINGQREFANAFIVNGSDSEEDVNMGTAIIPNLDSIAEFRILTSNFDAEYGEFSGGQINVITKSGSNAFHGDAFEFLRNTDLDARNYFSPARGTFHSKPVRRNLSAAPSGATRFSSSATIKAPASARAWIPG
jgi:hypothetical protein